MLTLFVICGIYFLLVSQPMFSFANFSYMYFEQLDKIEIKM